MKLLSLLFFFLISVPLFSSECPVMSLQNLYKENEHVLMLENVYAPMNPAEFYAVLRAPRSNEKLLGANLEGSLEDAWGHYTKKYGNPRFLITYIFKGDAVIGNELEVLFDSSMAFQYEPGKKCILFISNVGESKYIVDTCIYISVDDQKIIWDSLVEDSDNFKLAMSHLNSLKAYGEAIHMLEDVYSKNIQP